MALSHYRYIRILKQEKAKIFFISYPSTSRRLWIETWIKKLNLVFTENLVFLGISKLMPVLGICSLWESRHDMSHQIQFWAKTVFPGTRKAGTVKQIIIKKLSNTDIYSWIFEQMYLLLTFYGFSGKSKNFPDIFVKYSEKTICISYVANRITFGEKPFYQKNPKICRKKPVSCFYKKK